MTGGDEERDGRRDAPEDAGPAFEEALEQLDLIVARLEAGGVGLEEAVTLFERGQEHLRVCRARLDVAQRRIEELTAEELPDDGRAEPERPL